MIINYKTYTSILIITLFSIAVSAQVNLTNGLVAHYPFNGNFNDISGNGNHGTGMNGVSFGPDQNNNPNSAASFDGVNDWVSVTPANNLNVSKEFSIVFNFKSNASGKDQAIINKVDYSGTFSPNNFQFQVSHFAPVLPSDGLNFGTMHSGSCITTSFAPANYLLSPDTFVTGDWYCVVLTFDSGVKKMFINGLLINQQTVTGVNGFSIDSCNSPLKFGVWWQNNPLWLDGMLDEVRIYNRALNTLEVAALCTTTTTSDTVINAYAAVQSHDPCTNIISVDDATDFNIGDTILMIQMKGATIDTTNTANFGNILNYNGAGNYEYNTIKAKTGNQLTLKYRIVRQYDIPQGKVQIVRVPNYQNYTVSQPHTCMPWNGSKGGVFIINVLGTLTLNDDIDVSGKGFRGGQPLLLSNLNCNQTNYFYPSVGNNGGMKGEGITEVTSGKLYGRGALANGGGGGNGHNAGGGGGGNVGNGGNGGNQYNYIQCSPSITPNIGGVGGDLNFNNTNQRIFLGGGGGVGHGNDQGEKYGGNGGGIVFINGLSIVANNHFIKANGASPSVGIEDGGSGGGAGGSIYINANPTNLTLESTGGNGGDASTLVNNTPFGPGGGGSGGAILLTNTLPTPSTNVSNGMNGIFTNTSSPYGAQPGQPGQVVNNYPAIPFPTDTFSSIIVNTGFIDSFINCNTVKFINLSSGNPNITWSWSFGDGNNSTAFSPTHIYSSSGTYTVTLTATDSSGCSDTAQKTIHIGQIDSLTLIYHFCKDTTIIFNGQTISTTGIYIDSFKNQIGCDSLVILDFAIAPLPPVNLQENICLGDTLIFNGKPIYTAGIYSDTFTTAQNCDSIVILTANIIQPAINNIFIKTCNPDTSFVFNGTPIDSIGTYSFNFLTADGCDSTINLSLALSEPPTVDFSYQPITPELNEPTTFTNQSQNATRYLWDFGDSTQTTEENPVHLFNESGFYTVCLTGWNDAGCFATTCKRIASEVLATIEVPTAFSPNKDGNNDILYVRTVGIKEFTFRLYNRWGQMVFETNDASIGWDGTYNGQKQSSQAFAYTIQAITQNNKNIEKSGNITLLR